MYIKQLLISLIYLIKNINAQELSITLTSPNITNINNNIIINDNKPNFGTINNRRLNVFGKDDRQVIDFESDINGIFPYRTVGRLDIPVLKNGKFNGGFQACTATLIGRDLILTNKHCTGYEKAETLPQVFWDNVVFYLGLLKDGRIHAESGVVRIRWPLNTYEGYRLNDWTIFQLDKALGDVYGHLGIREVLPVYFKKTKVGNLAGYSGDLDGAAGVHMNCESKGLSEIRKDYILIQHDCDSTRGSSGSSFFQNDYFVVGLHFGERRDGTDSEKGIKYSDDYSNLMMSTDNFYSEFLVALEWPPRPEYPPTQENDSPAPTPDPFGFIQGPINNKTIILPDESLVDVPNGTPIDSSDSDENLNNVNVIKYNKLLTINNVSNFIIIMIKKLNNILVKL